MGGCCCSARKAHLGATTGYYYCPPIFEERESLTSHDAAEASTFSSGLVDFSLETSTVDSYRAPPTPLPYDIVLGLSPCPNSGGGAIPRLKNFGAPGNVIELNGKPQSTPLCLSEMKIELSKLDEVKTLDSDEEEVCPICLEEYDPENPKLITSCGHYFHMSCLVEWMERSDVCPICDKVMMFENSFV
ncbi:hypothetical protein MLD38_018275 [Melastoma candidum]|uniref:Uncharacterized protein n=1 Tax=Melastoma candidum TaxID=119954 RepID=A0ACB9QUF0_9MYRT|nr:hypothetical protein MLD38_018275 [Melastoma candidum]